jgi:integrase
MPEKKRRPRGQVVPLGDRTYGIRVQTKERGPNGRSKTHYETISGVTQLQAEKHKERLLAQIDAGLFFQPAPMTFVALVTEWLEQKKRAGLRPASLYTYGDVARIYVTPHIGQLQLKDVSARTLRDLYNTLQDQGLSDCTIKYARALVQIIMRDAVRWGYLKENPAQGVQAPKGAAGRVAHCLDLDEARSLIQAALLDLDDLVFAFALLTGLRPEEYIGLPRQNLELVEQGETTRGLVRVRQVAVKLRAGGGWTFPTPKTEKGIRDVPFPAWLYHELQRLACIVDARRRVMGAEWVDHNLVFPTRRGTPHQRSALELRFRRLLKRAELPVHFTLYSLRYTFATLQYVAGERDKVISELMGHTRTDFTKAVYTKVLPGMREQASDSLERLLFGAVRTTLAQSASEQVM